MIFFSFWSNNNNKQSSKKLQQTEKKYSFISKDNLFYFDLYPILDLI